MHIEHLALWVDDLDRMRHFYVTYFGCTAGDLYVNPTRHFTSCFLQFSPGKARLELMHQPDISDAPANRGRTKGITHFAITVGGKEAVDQLTERLRADHYTILGEPRTTGDGYYESVVLDPEGNHLELTA